MKIERTKNAGRNIIFGCILKLYQIGVPFLMRTVMIYYMGVQYLGLSSLFASVLQVLNLAELGVGSALVYSMYKPIAEDDNETICALMRIYKIYYRIIGFVIAVLGLLFLPFVPMVVKSDLPPGLNLYVLYLLNLTVTVLSYWMFAYKSSLLLAHQRNDEVSKVNLITMTIQYALQFIVIILFHNYYLYVMVALATQVLTNVVTAIVADRMFPQYKPKGNLDESDIKKINRRIKDLFTSKIGSVVVNSVDTIVISAFLGLTPLAIYQNYYYIINSIIGFVLIVFQSCTAGIGNSLVVETKEKNLQDLHKFTFIISWIGGFCATCLICLYQPFMEIWVGKELMLGFNMVICFSAYFYIHEINQLLNTYKDAAGIWHEDRFRPLVTALVNLAMNLIFVQKWGLYGVKISTIFSMLFVGMPWILYNLFTVLFNKKDLKNYIQRLIYYAVVSTISCVLAYNICGIIHLTGWWCLIVRGCICVLISNVLFFVVYHKQKEFRQACQVLNKLTKNKIPIIKRYLDI